MWKMREIKKEGMREMVERTIYSMPEHLKKTDRLKLELEKLEPGCCFVITPSENQNINNVRSYAKYHSKKLGINFKVKTDKDKNIFVYREA